jgi:probable F420-dependent oxidoreductase
MSRPVADSRLRSGAVKVGRVGIFAGALTMQPAAVQRAMAQEIEKMGFGCLWYGESVIREAFAQGAILLSATSELAVATGIANIRVRDPTAMANGSRALGEAWPGRFVLGLGASHRSVLEARGLPADRPLTAMREYLDAMEGATWLGPEVEAPPIVLAALGPRMVALAAERTAGIFPYFTTLDHVRQLRQQLGPDRFLAVDLPIVLSEDRAEARRIGGRQMERCLALEVYRGNLLRLGWSQQDMAEGGSDALFDAIFAWGGRQRVEARLRETLAAGADHVVFNIQPAEPTTPYFRELEMVAAMSVSVSGQPQL